jgi:uncharacterized membrane protein
MKKVNTRTIVYTGILLALQEILCFSPIGNIRTPIVSITISHIAILISSIALGLTPGVILAIVFGLTSMFMALTQPTGILDIFFVNPLVSILPRLFIPIFTYYSFLFMNKFIQRHTLSQNHNKILILPIIVSVTAGNLTNTFLTYASIYIFYAKKIMHTYHKSALNLIVSSIAMTTMIKCVFVLVIVVPVTTLLLKYQQDK